MRPTDEIFVTTDIHEGFKRTGQEVTDKDPPGHSAEPSPIRPEGPHVRSPGWDGTGGIESEQTAALKYDRWANDAGARQNAMHESIAASAGKEAASHSDLHKMADSPTQQPGQEQAADRASQGLSNHDDLHQQMDAAKQEVTVPPQTVDQGIGR